MTEPYLTDAPDYQQLLLTSTESTYSYGHGTGAHSYVTYITLASLQATKVDEEGMVRVTVREGWQDFEQWGDFSWYVYDREYEMKIPLARLQRLALEARFQLPSSLAPVLEGPLEDLSISEWRPKLEVEYRHHIQFTELWRHFHWIGSQGQKDRWRGGAFFHKEEAYKKLSTDTRVIEFGVIEWPSLAWNRKEAMELVLSKGVRPAVFDELFACSKAFPRIKGEAQLHALGSIYDAWGDGPQERILATPMIQAVDEWRGLHFLRHGEVINWDSRCKRYLLVVTNDPSL